MQVSQKQCVEGALYLPSEITKEEILIIWLHGRLQSANTQEIADEILPMLTVWVNEILKNHEIENLF